MAPRRLSRKSSGSGTGRLENQDQTENRYSHLFAIARVLQPPVIFISAEPLLGPLDLKLVLPLHEYLWVIAGGESGPQARLMHLALGAEPPRLMRRRQGAFLLRAMGEWVPFRHPDHSADYPKNAEVKNVRVDGSPLPGEFKVNAVSFQSMVRIGKKGAGRLLDGAEHSGFPQMEVVS